MKRKQKSKWYCKLCQRYDIENRTQHLVKIHNAILGKNQDTNIKPLHEFLFNSVIQQ